MDTAGTSEQIEYLAAKRTVDDRALNHHVWGTFWRDLPRRRLRALEVGCGIGTMIERILEAGVLAEAEYTAVDLNPDFLREGRSRLMNWAERHQRPTEAAGDRVTIGGKPGRLTVRFVAGDANGDLASLVGTDWDLLLSHALLDLLNLERVVPSLLGLLGPSGRYYFSLNFDGLTRFLPAIDPELDLEIEDRYHRTMERRRLGGEATGGSLSGRRLLALLQELGAAIDAVGGSDWAVHPVEGEYPAQEGQFLRYILETIGSALEAEPSPPARLADWLQTRRLQLERAELILLTHQLDVCGRPP